MERPKESLVVKNFFQGYPQKEGHFPLRLTRFKRFELPENLPEPVNSLKEFWPARFLTPRRYSCGRWNDN